MVDGSLSFNVQDLSFDVLPNSDPFGQTEKRGRGCKNWTFFMDVINVWSPAFWFYKSVLAINYSILFRFSGKNFKFHLP